MHHAYGFLADSRVRDDIAREKALRQEYAGLLREVNVASNGMVPSVGTLAAARRARERAWRQAMAICDSHAAHIHRIRHELAMLTSSDPAIGIDAGPAQRAQLAIEEFVTSVLVRLYERRRLQLGVRTIRPWDIEVVPVATATEPAFRTHDELYDAVHVVLRSISSRGSPDAADVGRHLPLSGAGTSPPDPMRSAVFAHHQQVLDALHTCLMRDDVTRLGAEAMPIVAELLVLQGHLSARHDRPAQFARLAHLERTLLRWTVGAMLDAFDRWTGDSSISRTPSDRTDMWFRLWLRFLPAIDWSDLDSDVSVSWLMYLGSRDAYQTFPSGVGEEVAAWHWWIAGNRASPLDYLAAARPDNDGADALMADTVLHDVARWMEDSIESLEVALDVRTPSRN